MKNIRNMAFIALIAIFAVSCKQEATSEVKEGTAVKTEVLAENLETASMNIEGMTCEVGCAKLIEGKLTGAAGVTEAKVDFEAVTKIEGGSSQLVKYAKEEIKKIKNLCKSF